MGEKDLNFNLVWKTIGEENLTKIKKQIESINKEMKELVAKSLKATKVGTKMGDDLARSYLAQSKESSKGLVDQKKKLNSTIEGLSDFRLMTKQLHMPIGMLTSTLKESGIAVNKQGSLINASTKRAMPYTQAIEKMISSHNTFGGVMNMNRDVFMGLTKQGYKFSGAGAQMAANVRVLTHGLHGFKMEFLSVMFFGMQMQRIGLSLLGPAMKMYGITELFSSVLAVVMLPIMSLIYPTLLKIALWLISAPSWFKVLLGLGAIFMVLGGTLMFFGAQFGLFLGSTTGWVGIFVTTIGKMAGAFRHPIKGMIAMGGFFKRTILKMWLTAKIGFGSIGKTTKTQTTLMNGTIKKAGNTSVRSVGMAGKGMVLAGGPIFWLLAALAAAVVVFALAWKNNWGGIRQKVGAFVSWFSGVYDFWIKPVLMHFGTGIIVLKNVIGFALRNIKDIWSFTWLTIKSVAFRTWNAILTGIEMFVNGMLLPFRVLYKIGGGLVEKIFGFKVPNFPEFNLSKFKKSTKEVDSELLTVKNRLKTGLKDMAVKTVKDVNWLDDTLSGFTDTMKKAGEGMIESGDRMDAERAAKEANKEKTSILTGAVDKLKSGLSNLVPGVALASDKIDDQTTAYDNLSLGINDDILPAFTDTTDKLEEVKKGFISATEKVNDYSMSLKEIPSESVSGVSKAAKKISTGPVYGPVQAIRSKAELERKIGTIGSRDWKKVAKSLGISTAWKGGIFTNPALTTIAEKGPEAVIPLDKSGGIGGLGNITIHNSYYISGVSSPEDVENQIEEANSKLIDDLKSMIR